MERFSCYWKNVRLKHPLLERLKKASKSFSCYWKNVRLKPNSGIRIDLSHGVSVVIERMYDWSDSYLVGDSVFNHVSVVIERMYDWSLFLLQSKSVRFCFSCYWKNVRLKRGKDYIMSLGNFLFQLLLKECTIEAENLPPFGSLIPSFSCYWKNVRLKLRNQLIENKRFLTVGFWSVFRKWSICTKSAIIFENLGWLLDCFW